MESFYGGRQGISFIIVKRFDAISVSEENEKAIRYFAFDNNPEVNSFIFENGEAIERTPSNYKKYSDWKLHIADGKDGFPDIPAEGMVQCFERGGISTDIVNYGEYVIIDTPNKNDLDNGKVYRRGLNFQYDEVNNPLAGAEYIGQIVGPQGNSPELIMDSYNKIVEEGGPATEGYVADIVAGKVSDDIYNDEVKYTYITIKDEFGVITKCKVGFQFPYHVFEFETDRVSAYLTEDEEKNLVIRTDDREHPFYSKWKISIPRGIKGDAITNLYIENETAKTGSVYYTDIACAVSTGNTLTTDILIDFDKISFDIEENIGRPILINDEVYYVKKEDTYKQVLIYKYINYDNQEEGEFKYIKIGGYDTVKNIELNEDGTFTVFYSYSNPTTTTNNIQWIDNIKLTDDGNLEVIYNIDKENPVVVNENKIRYIIKSEIIRSIPEDYPNNKKRPIIGNLYVLYNDTYTLDSDEESGYYDWYIGTDDDGNPILSSGWVDLGPVIGNNGISLYAEFETIDYVKENYKDGLSNGYEGWMVCVIENKGTEEETRTLYFYDYDKAKNYEGDTPGEFWTEVGKLNLETSAVEPENIIQAQTSISTESTDNNNKLLKNNGFVFIKDNNNIISSVNQKINNTYVPHYFSTLSKYIKPTTNSLLNSLEEELLFGTTVITEEYEDENGNFISNTKFKKDSDKQYYQIISTIYKEKGENDVIKIDIFYYVDEENIEPLFRKVITETIPEDNPNKRIIKEEIIPES